MKQGSAFLFPGQGAFYAGALRECKLLYPCVEQVLSEVDGVAVDRFGQSISKFLWSASPKSLDQCLAESPDLLQLAMYAVSVGTYQILRSEGVLPSVLVGHSFGEIPALVCAGRYSVGDGAAIVCDRIEALSARADRDGYMLAVQVDEAVVSHAVRVVGDERAVVAVSNHSGQTIVSGPTAALDQLQRLTQAMKWSTLRLKSPYAFHSPLVAGAADDFAERLRRYPQRPLQVRVHSPILGREYVDGDDTGNLLAAHLKLPVKFSSAIRQLLSEGCFSFIECGALDALSRIVEKIAGRDRCLVVPSIGGGEGEVRQLRDSIRSIHSLENLPMQNSATLIAAELDDFWKVHGTNIIGYIKSEMQVFISNPHKHDAPVERRPVLEAVESRPAPERSAPASSARPAAAPIPRDRLYGEIVAIYAEAMEYPAEVFTEQVELEAELGIDSVRQTELLGRISERYQLPPRPDNFRMSDYRTMGQVVDFVHHARKGAPVGMAA